MKHYYNVKGIRPNAKCPNCGNPLRFNPPNNYRCQKCGAGYQLKLVRNISSPGRNGAKQVPCPVCGVTNVVGPASLYLRCSGCGRPLLKVNVKRK